MMKTNVNIVCLMNLINLVGETRFMLVNQSNKLEGYLDRAGEMIPETVTTLDNYVNGVNQMIEQGLYEPDTAKRVLMKFDTEYNILAVAPEWQEVARKYCAYVKHDMCSSHNPADIEGNFGVSLLFEYGNGSPMLSRWELYEFWKVWKAKQSNINRKKVK